MNNCLKFKYLSFIFYCGFPPVHMQTFLVNICSLDFWTFCSETRNQYCVDNYRWFAKTAASPRTSGLQIGCPWRRVAETCRARMSSLGPTGPKYQNTDDDDDSLRFFCTRNKKTRPRSFYPLGTSAMAHVSVRVRYRDTTVQLGMRTNRTGRWRGRMWIYHGTDTGVTATMKETGESRALTLHRRTNGGGGGQTDGCRAAYRFVYPVGGRRTVAAGTIRHRRCARA